MLTDDLIILDDLSMNHFKNIFMEKEKAGNILTIFSIFHKNCVKIFLK